jgi:circadian clock protein KaiC
MPIRKELRTNAPLKAPTGIDGLDSITGGGLPRGRLTTILGGAGAGKTLLALQSLVHGARALHEPGIFVAFEEHSGDIVANAACFGWDLPGLRNKKLFFLDAQPAYDTVQSGDFDLCGMLAALDVKIVQMKARRIVFDAVDVLLSMLESETSRRRELFRLRDWLMSRSLSTIITSKTDAIGTVRAGDDLQFMADCAVELDHRFSQGRSQRTLHVLKYRGSQFHENDSPYTIGAGGLNVANLSVGSGPRPAVTDERVSSGIERLDTMLGGGFYRNAGILVTGAPGTAKTTLSGSFAETACERGEPTLFVSFDSDTDEIVRNLASVGIRLQRHMGSTKRPGLLKMCYARALEGSAETHLFDIQSLARAHAARCVVIDPISALAMAGNEAMSQAVAKRLMDWAKSQGITLFLNSLLRDGHSDGESSPMQVSTFADTWIHLSYLVRGGERNRCLSLVKSRGTAHSNQVRELVLSAEGVTLTDAYTAGGEVLLGTLRWEREESEKAARRAAERAEGSKRVNLAYQETDLVGRMDRLQRKLNATRQELKTVEETKKLRRVDQSGGRSHRSKLRGRDVEPGKPGGPVARP